MARGSGGKFSVLLIKDSYGHWTWPKGNIDKDESPEAAALREIREETGIGDAIILEKIGETTYHYKLHDILRFKTVYIYLCETAQEKLQIQASEIREGRWCTPEEALGKIEYKGSKKLLKKALERFTEIKKI